MPIDAIWHRKAPGLAFAVFVVCLATAAGLFVPVFVNKRPYFLFTFASVLAAHCGGLRAGLLASVLSCLSLDWFFLEPIYAFGISDPEHAVRFSIFATGTFTLTALTGRAHDQGGRSGSFTPARAAELERVEQCFEALVLDDRDRVAIRVTPEGQIGDVVGPALQRTGYVATELTGRPLSQLFERETPRELRCCLDLAAELGRLEVTKNCRHKDGTRYTAAVVFTPLWDVPEASGWPADGRASEDETRLGGFLVIVRDAAAPRPAVVPVSATPTAPA
jgi:hypothetical protein